MVFFLFFEWILEAILFIIGLPLGIVAAWIAYTIIRGLFHFAQNIYEEFTD